MSRQKWKKRSQRSKKFYYCQNYTGVHLDTLQNLTRVIHGENLENVRVVTVQNIGVKWSSEEKSFAKDNLMSKQPNISKDLPWMFDMKRLLMVHFPDNYELKMSLEDSTDVTDMSFAFVCLCGFWDGSCLCFSAFILLLLESGRLP